MTVSQPMKQVIIGVCCCALQEMLDASVDGNETTPVSSLHTDKQAVELDEKVRAVTVVRTDVL